MNSLQTILPKKSGRSKGRILVRHQGGRHKRFLRQVDFKRSKKEVWGVVETIEYDPNRNADIALILYEDGERKYILAPSKLELGDKIVASAKASIKPGNALPISKIPVGTQIHNLEIKPGKGGQIVKGAGSVAVIQGKEEDWVLIKLPSGEIKRFKPDCYATVGQVSNEHLKSERIGSAGRKRRMGVRPSVRGVAMHPGAHAHGGGEGRSGVGRKYPLTVYGKPAVGKTRKKKKYSDKLIIKGRKKGKHS
jgi:large subunit ribosomal protein L2